jgi:hypothetical protein
VVVAVDVNVDEDEVEDEAEDEVEVYAQWVEVRSDLGFRFHNIGLIMAIIQKNNNTLT